VLKELPLGACWVETCCSNSVRLASLEIGGVAASGAGAG
jgi:hypothetical protein